MQTPEYHAAKRSGYLARLKPIAIERSVKTLALMLTLVALWLMTHRYQGLGGDAELYAVQAMARIHSNLLNDLFLRNTSQDAYTVFSPFYAWCIALFGLRNAALILTIVFKIWFFGAAWALARRLSDSHTAFLAVALLIITVGAYGAYGVFRYAEDWVTARSLAEALVITALALYFRGARVIGLLVACGAMFVHPLMALPGVLLLMCLNSSLRTGAIGAAAAMLSVARDRTQCASAEHDDCAFFRGHGCRLVASGARTLAVSIPAALAPCRLATERPPVHVFDCQRDSHWRSASSQAVHLGHAGRGDGIWQWRSSQVSSVRSASCCKVKHGVGSG